MPRKNWILILVPLLLGALASFLVQQIWEPVPILAFRVDVGMVAFVAGAFLTLLFGAAHLGGWVKERKTQRLIEQSLQESEQGRQCFIRRINHEIKNPLTGLRAALVNL
jgi:nitrogen-specific signal transduction histidine kinase